MKSPHVARKVALLGSSVAVFAFTCGFVGTKYLIDNDQTSTVETLISSKHQASSCSDQYSSSAEPCYSTSSKGYFREWRLWSDVPQNDKWPEAVNEKEESIHSKRFDGVVPNLQKQALDALQVKDINEVDPTVLKDTINTLSEQSTPVYTDEDGEGGRRLDETSTDDDEATLSLIVYNSYTKGSVGSSDGTSNSEYPWTYIVEPFRATTLELDNTVPGATYRWNIDGHIHGFGTSTEALFSDIGYHNVNVEESIIETDGSTTTNKLAVKVMCKYVRREIRGLSNLDREAWLSAISVIQHVPTTVGRSIYGSKYLSKDAFTRVHLYYGGAMDCDHWHQGAGFVTSHVALTLQFEQALQSINPTITTPYWDFTLESTFFGSRDWRDSFIFSDDWFGNPDPDNDLHTPTAGRFNFVETLRDCKKFSYWINSYGLLRAPWNNDPTPFLTRSAKIYGYYNNMKPSGCAEYHISLKKTSWMSMSKQLNSAAHGHIHELMGGSWNHYYKNLVDNEDHPAVYTFAHSIQQFSKILWRYGYVKCPDSCDMTTASADCQCMCSAESLQGKSSLEVLTEAGIFSGLEFFDKDFHKLDKSQFMKDGEPANPIQGYTEEATKHIHNNLLAILCNPGHIGDMYQATSTNDITFWVIHNTVDRLWHYKRLGNLNNYDETWDPYHSCYGHNPRNYQPFPRSLFSTAPTASSHRRLDDGTTEKKNGIAPTSFDPSVPNFDPVGYVTNIELYANLHPSSRSLQYVYDNFKWDHCTRIGFKFSNRW